MIEISNFKQAYLRFESNPLLLPIVQDLAYLVINICDPQNPPTVNSASTITTQHLQWLSNQEAAELSFDAYMGGNAYICESESELSSIKSFDPAWADEYGEWPDVTDQPMVWDVCHKLNEEWAVFCCIWNNAGGDLYYVPSFLWQQARLDEHTELN
jgi:hypothetical protein